MDHNNRTTNEQKRKSGINWAGILVFLLIAGSQFVPGILNSIQNMFGQSATIQQIMRSLPSLPMLIGGIIILAIVGSVISSFLNSLGAVKSGADSQNSTYLSTSSMPSSPIDRTSMPTSWGASDYNYTKSSSSPFPRGVHLGQTHPERSLERQYQYQLPQGINLQTPRSLDIERVSRSATPNRYQTPGFEPVVNGKVLVFGILGALLAIGAMLFGNWLAWLLP
jgi:hypothetical protein